MDKAKVYIKENKERFISELLDLLRIPSISAQSERKPDMQRCAEFLAAALVKAGADRADVLPTEGNPVVYAEKTVDPGAKTVLVYGHYDVMPVDPRDEWRTEPFEPVIRDGRIWGRGADDDKGQLMKNGAVNAMMSGSGPTVFGIFDDPDKAEFARDQLKISGLSKQTFLTTVSKPGGTKYGKK